MSPGGGFSAPTYETVTSSSFSLFAVLGNGILGVAGFFVMYLIVVATSPELLKDKDTKQANADLNGDAQRGS